MSGGIIRLKILGQNNNKITIYPIKNPFKIFVNKDIIWYVYNTEDKRIYDKLNLKNR